MKYIRIPRLQSLIANAISRTQNAESIISVSENSASDSVIGDQEAVGAKTVSRLRCEIAAENALANGNVLKQGYPPLVNLQQGLGAFAKLDALSHLEVHFKFPASRDKWAPLHELLALQQIQLQNQQRELELDEDDVQQGEKKQTEKEKKEALEKEAKEAYLNALHNAMTSESNMKVFDETEFHPSEIPLRNFVFSIVPRLAFHNPHISFGQESIAADGNDEANSSGSGPTVILRDVNGKETILTNCQFGERELLAYLEDCYQKQQQSK